MIIKHDEQLQPYNSFRTKALAKIFCEPRNNSELIEVIKAYPGEKKLILGAGFNLFFTKDFDGLVIKPAMEDIIIIAKNDLHVDIKVGAGVEWDTLVERSVAQGFSGIENLSLIPSSVGACPVQNIGAYGSEVRETITRVEAVDINSGEQKIFSNEECQFGYRDSFFKRNRDYAIASVTFRLSKLFTYKEKYIDLSRELNGVSSPTLAQVREAIVRIRSRKLPDPLLLPNAGSFFKNPLLNEEEKERLLGKIVDAPIYNMGENQFKTSAAFLIDKAGYKGKRRGMVGTYEHHSLVVVNHGTGDGNDIVAFIQEVQREVEKKFGVKLEPEVQIY